MLIDLEEKIMSCWSVVDDIETLRRAMLDMPEPLTTDQVDNYLLGLSTIYSVKFEELFAKYEAEIKRNAKK